MNPSQYKQNYASSLVYFGDPCETCGSKGKYSKSNNCVQCHKIEGSHSVKFDMAAVYKRRCIEDHQVRMQEIRA